MLRTYLQLYDLWSSLSASSRRRHVGYTCKCFGFSRTPNSFQLWPSSNKLSLLLIRLNINIAFGSSNMVGKMCLLDLEVHHGKSGQLPFLLGKEKMWKMSTIRKIGIINWIYATIQHSHSRPFVLMLEMLNTSIQQGNLMKHN